MPKLELQEGIYHGLYEIAGGAFQISFWTVATDISPEQARERMAFAEQLVRRFNDKED